MRLFVAVEVSEQVQLSFKRLIAELKEGISRAGIIRNARFVRPDSIHLTLVFLGEIPEDRLQQVAAALERVPTFRCFEYELGGLGAFPTLGRSRVLWAGTQTGTDRIARLAGEVRKAVADCVVAERQEEEYVPHLTICRFRRPENLNKLEVFKALQDTEIGTCRANRFLLMKSIVYPYGTKYEVVRPFRLGGPGA